MDSTICCHTETHTLSILAILLELKTPVLPPSDRGRPISAIDVMPFSNYVLFMSSKQRTISFFPCVISVSCLFRNMQTSMSNVFIKGNSKYPVTIIFKQTSMWNNIQSYVYAVVSWIIGFQNISGNSNTTGHQILASWWSMVDNPCTVLESFTGYSYHQFIFQVYTAQV
jgi:hypothetical protein